MTENMERDEMNGRRALLGWGDCVLSAVLNAAGAKEWSEWLRVPLEHALMSGQTHLAKKLVEAGADCSAGYGVLGQRTLLTAATFGAGQGAVQMVLDVGVAADLNLSEKDDLGMAPLHFAVLKADHDAIRLLCSRGASPQVRNNEGSTPLHMASVMGDEEATFELLKSLDGGGHDVRNSEDCTPLHYAASNRATRRDLSGWRRVNSPPFSHVAVICRLLMAGADVETRNSAGYTPLRIAVTELFPDAVRVLLRHGADETSISNDDSTMAASLREARDFYRDRVGPGGAPAVEALVSHVSDMLARAPADRAWRRRGWLVMLRRRVCMMRRIRGAMEHRQRVGGDAVSAVMGGEPCETVGVKKPRPSEVVQEEDVADLVDFPDGEDRNTRDIVARPTKMIQSVVTRQCRSLAASREDNMVDTKPEYALYDFGLWCATVCQEGIFRHVVGFL